MLEGVQYSKDSTILDSRDVLGSIDDLRDVYGKERRGRIKHLDTACMNVEYKKEWPVQNKDVKVVWLI